jgi:alcohol dehydrogenase class IV
MSGAVLIGPRRVLSGAGSRRALGAELRSLGALDGQVLIVSDAALSDLGVTADAERALAAEGFGVRVLPPVAQEPTVDTIVDLLDAAGNDDPAAVIGIGGGSVIDASKLLGAALAQPFELATGLKPDSDRVAGPPTLMVPTTAGTGAECTQVAMLWAGGRKVMFVHPLLVPHGAVLDPELLASAPPSVVAASGMDAVSHAVEAMLSTLATPLTQTRSRAALALLADGLLPAFQTRDAHALARVSLGAFEAGLALSASVVIGHSLAYAIAARARLSHGVSCAVALPFCVAHYRDACPEAIADMARTVGAGTDAADFLRWLVGMNESLGIPPSLAEVGIDQGQAREIASECVSLYPRPNSPVPFDIDAITRLVECMVRGDVRGAWAVGSDDRRQVAL